jgi:hypothetical protein
MFSGEAARALHRIGATAPKSRPLGELQAMPVMA